MRRAFSFAELMIAVAILGILAAIVTPTLQSHILRTKEATAKENLRILRSAIELYAAQHNSIAPGYSNNDPSNPALSSLYFFNQMIYESHYLAVMPANPFNEEVRIIIVPDHQAFPTEATGEYGWIYKRQTKEIRLDWPGADSKGVRYFDY